MKTTTNTVVDVVNQVKIFEEALQVKDLTQIELLLEEMETQKLIRPHTKKIMLYKLLMLKNKQVSM